MLAMLGWLSVASSSASRWKRASRSASSANGAERNLSATSRFSRVSRARKTSPIPPAPRSDTISYDPKRLPGVGDIETRSNYIEAELYGGRAIEAELKLGATTTDHCGNGLR